MLFIINKPELVNSGILGLPSFSFEGVLAAEFPIKLYNIRY